MNLHLYISITGSASDVSAGKKESSCSVVLTLSSHCYLSLIWSN